MSRIVIIDTETTGLTNIDQVIELAIFEEKIENFEIFGKTLQETIEYISKRIEVTRYKPKVPINPRAYDVHKIGLKELKSAPCTSTVEIPRDIDYIIGHNISYDLRLLVQSNENLSWVYDIPSICTKTLAQSLKKNLKIPLPSAKLAELTEYYYPEHIETLAAKSHAAKTDVINTTLVTLAMLQHLPKIESFSDLHSFQQFIKGNKK
jgi:exodeoxyribonuclease X